MTDRSALPNCSHDDYSRRTYAALQLGGPSCSTRYDDPSRSGACAVACASSCRPDTDDSLLTEVRLPHERSLAPSNPKRLQPRHAKAARCAGERGGIDGFGLAPVQALS